MLVSGYVLRPHKCFRASSQGGCGLLTFFVHLGLCSIFIDEVSQWFPQGQTLGSLITRNIYQKKLFHVLRTISGFSETFLWVLISFLLKSSSMWVWYRAKKWSADKTCGHYCFFLSTFYIQRALFWILGLFSPEINSFCENLKSILYTDSSANKQLAFQQAKSCLSSGRNFHANPVHRILTMYSYCGHWWLDCSEALYINMGVSILQCWGSLNHQGFAFITQSF